jgi:hypothetical protein
VAELRFGRKFLMVFTELSVREQGLIVDHLDLLQTFPEMYPVRQTGPRVFCGLRYFIAGNWHVYYKYTGDTIELRLLWPARIPYR